MRMLAVLAICAAPTLALGADPTVKTPDGRWVVLHANGTWEYADVVTPPPETSSAPAPAKPKWAEDVIQIWDTSLVLDYGEYGRNSVRLFLHYANDSDRQVVAVVSRVVIASPLGKTLLKDTFEEESVVQPRSRERNRVFWAYEDNQFIQGQPYDRLWQVAQNGTAKITAKVLKVVLDDGTVLKARKP